MKMAHRLPLTFDWCEYKGETVFAGLNYQRSLSANKPMFDIHYCATQALNNNVMFTTQWDKSKFKPSHLGTEWIIEYRYTGTKEMKHFANNVKHLRRKVGMTQQQLADHLEQKRPTIGAWEEARTYPRVPTLVKLCALFEVSIDTMVLESLKEAEK